MMMIIRMIYGTRWSLKCRRTKVVNVVNLNQHPGPNDFNQLAIIIPSRAE